MFKSQDIKKKTIKRIIRFPYLGCKKKKYKKQIVKIKF